MQIKSEKLQKNQMELVIEVSSEEIKSNLEAAAQRLSKQIKIEGFRPGKAPYDIVKAKVGEAAILEGALEDIVQKTYNQAIKDEHLVTVGPPKIEVEKAAPGNPIVYRATISLLPELKMADLKSVKVKRKKVEVTEEKIDKTIEELRKMQKKEVITDKPAAKEDKLVVDMDMFLDKVPVEGGQTKDHQVYLSDNHFVPGLQEKLVGMSRGEEREFALPFPKEHYNKALADKNVDFKVKAKEVFEVKLPEVNDEFAKNIGFQSVDDLTKQVKVNIQKEDEQKEEQRLEGEIVDEIIKKSEFTDIPEVLLDAEIDKMIHELEHSISAQGLKFDDYLKHIKKTKEELKNEFVSQAERRVKGALIMRQVTESQAIDVSDKEVEEEVNRLIEMYKNDPETQDKIKEEGYKAFLRNVLVNRKAIAYLKERCVEE